MAGFQIDETLMLSGTEGFIKALANAAKQTQKDFGIYASVTLGQAIIESGWGKSPVSKENKNLFGIKYSSGYKPAPGINVKAAGRQCPSSEQGGAMYYVFYESYGDSVYDHGNFLKVNPRYTKAGVFSAKDAKEQMKAICAAGYAEVGGQYSTSVISAMDKYNLYQYDDLTDFSGIDVSYSSPNDGSGYGTGMDILPNVDHRYNVANMDEVKGACLIFLPPYNVCAIDEMETHFKTWNNWDRQYHYLIDPTYDMDANPDDDIPDLTNAKHIDEMNNSSDDSNNDTDTEDDDNRSRTIQPRAPLGPGDMDSGTNTPQQPGDGGDGGGAQLTENDFSAASFVGDSLTVGLGQTVSGINTFATVGQTVGKGRVEHAQAVINKGSKVVIISYGTNDSGYKDTSGFITNYKNLINDIKKGIPGVTIFVNKIFPGDASKADSNGKACIENIPAHNDALNQICSDTGAFLMDCTGIPNLMSYYSNDGIHFKSEFYKLWYEDMKSKVLNHTGGNTSNNNSS